MADLARNDVYELPLALHMELSERRWRAFAQECLRGDTVYVFECCFIQNPVTVTMIRSDSPKEVTAGFVRRLADAAAPLDPVLVYVEQASIRDSFRKAVSERPAQWLEGFTQYYLNQGYGLRRGLTGLGGVIEVLEARGALEREICGGLAMPVYRVDNSAFDREALQRRVAAIVEENFAR
jgi:hypothetical protein